MKNYWTYIISINYIWENKHRISMWMLLIQMLSWYWWHMWNKAKRMNRKPRLIPLKLWWSKIIKRIKKKETLKVKKLINVKHYDSLFQFSICFFFHFQLYLRRAFTAMNKDEKQLHLLMKMFKKANLQNLSVSFFGCQIHLSFLRNNNDNKYMLLNVKKL